MSESEDIDILREEMSQYQEKLQEIMQHNKELVKENNDLLDRFQTSQNYATELKARLKWRMVRTSSIISPSNAYCHRNKQYQIASFCSVRRH